MKVFPLSGTDDPLAVRRRAFLKFSLEAVAVGVLAGCSVKSPRLGDIASACVSGGLRAPIIPVENTIDWDDGASHQASLGRNCYLQQAQPEAVVLHLFIQ